MSQNWFANIGNFLIKFLTRKYSCNKTNYEINQSVTNKIFSVIYYCKKKYADPEQNEFSLYYLSKVNEIDLYSKTWCYFFSEANGIIGKSKICIIGVL